MAQLIARLCFRGCKWARLDQCKLFETGKCTPEVASGGGGVVFDETVKIKANC